MLLFKMQKKRFCVVQSSKQYCDRNSANISLYSRFNLNHLVIQFGKPLSTKESNRVKFVESEFYNVRFRILEMFLKTTIYTLMSD